MAVICKIYPLLTYLHLSTSLDCVARVMSHEISKVRWLCWGEGKKIMVSHYAWTGNLESFLSLTQTSVCEVFCITCLSWQVYTGQ